jgi:hypothetical protein
MHLKRASLVALLIIGVAHVAAAQQNSADGNRLSVSVDVSRLPIDLAKITRQLRQTEGTESHTGLHIRYTIDVYGAAPRIEFFTKEDNLQTGPVPYGAPTHREMINQVTPQEFRAPIADFSALLRWLADRGNKK